MSSISMIMMKEIIQSYFKQSKRLVSAFPALKLLSVGGEIVFLPLCKEKLSCCCWCILPFLQLLLVVVVVVVVGCR